MRSSNSSAMLQSEPSKLLMKLHPTCYSGIGANKAELELPLPSMRQRIHDIVFHRCKAFVHSRSMMLFRRIYVSRLSNVELWQYVK